MKIFDLNFSAQLSIAAYGAFSLELNNNVDLYLQALTDSDDGRPGMSEAQARAFIGVDENGNDIPGQGFEIVHSYEDPASGFAATIFRHKGTGKLHFAIRGTEFTDVNDLLADASLFYTGAAFSQILAMTNYYLRLITPKTEFAKQFEFRLDYVSSENSILYPGGDLSGRPQYLSLFETESGVVGLGAIAAVDNLAVTGHSLGGHLATAFAGIFSNVVSQAYTFNGAGIAVEPRLGFDNFRALFSAAYPASSSDVSDRITNIIAEPGVDFVPNINEQIGSQRYLFIEEQADPVSNHKLEHIADALAVMSLMEIISPTLHIQDASDFLYAISNQAESSLEKMVNVLSMIFGVNTLEVQTADREQLYTAIQNVKDSLAIRYPSGSPLTFNRLKHINANELAMSAAGGNLATLYALQNLSPFAIGSESETVLSDLYRPFVDNGLLKLDSYSEEYLKDRARLLTLIIQRNQNDTPYETQLFENRYYHDARLDVSLGVENVLFGGYSIETPRVIFGSRENDAITGSESTEGLFGDDKLYGRDGDDILEGLSGNDWLEGGEGDDTIAGGEGSDILIGGFGSDTYVFVDDSLSAGALDIINDIDGDGMLHLNGAPLDLSTLEKTAPNIWSTKNGDIQITFDSITPNSALLLALTKNGVTNRIQINNFRNNTFGINLPDFKEATLPVVDTTNSISGTANDDSANGTAANDEIKTFAGNDSVDGNEGDDNIDVGDGDDSVDGGDGNDHILGGAGQDNLWGRSGDDVIEGGSGFDLILGFDGDDELFANSFEDYNTILNSDNVTPGTDNDWLNADVGDDLLVGSTGNNGLSGGEGNDRLYGGAGNDVMFGDQYWIGESTWSMSIQIDTDRTLRPVFVDAYNRTLGEPGPGGNDVLIGGAGDDYMEGDRGSDILDGGIGDDVIGGGSGEDTIVGGDGNDYLYGDNPYIYVTAPDGQGNLVTEKRYIPEEHGADIIDGGAGDDYLQGHGGNDILTGGDGNDEIHGDDAEADLPSEYHGNDNIDGGAGDDLIYGYGGDDAIRGGDGNDTIAGDIAESRLVGSAHGHDDIDGGAGEDMIAGYGGNDVMRGGDDNDQLQGDASVAELSGEYHGNDTLYGGQGDDTIWGSGADDILHGGEGNDRLEGDAADLEGQYHGEDTIYGEAGDDHILGGGGGDKLYGGDGNDQILGDDFAGITEQYHGDDYIDGGAGDDVIRGNGGNDTIIGGVGVDHMGGGAGDDVYVLNSGDSFYDPQGFIEVIDDREGINTIRFGEGITAADVNAQIWEENLQLSFGSSDSVWVLSGADGNTVSRFEFADGSTLSWSEFFGRAYKAPLDYSSGDFGATLLGGSGDDRLVAFGGFGVLSGGVGNDTLGGVGGDTFLFSAGDGQDTIDEQGLNANAPNVVRFGAGVSRDMLSFAMQGNDLLVRVGYGTGDSLLIQNFRTDVLSGASTIDRFEFEDGTTLSYAEVRDEVGFVYVGGDASETYLGTASTDRMLGLGGNDVLDSGAGDDFLAGGLGDDVLRGGAGYDTYYVGRFEGADRIEEVDDGAGNQLQLGYGITPANLAFSTTEGGDLVLGLPNNGQVSIADGFGADGVRHISSVLFQDGTEWNAQDLLAHYLSSATDGNDYLRGTSAANTLAGGKGSDTLVGAEGDDLYLYNSGDAADTIIDIEGADTLRFGDGLLPEDWSVASDGQSLILRHSNGSDEITIQGWFVDSANEVERVEFADGTVWQSTDIVAGLSNQVGTDGDDVLVAPYSLDSSLSGLAGNDSLTGGGGNDTLDGGAGDDVLAGGTGDDTFLFDVGHGADVLVDAGGNDQIIFGETISSDSVSARRDGLDVVIAAINGTDAIRIADWFADNGGSNHIESIRFSDGTQWSADQLTDAALVQVGDEGNNTLAGLDGYDDKLAGLGGADVLFGGSGNDTLDGGTGNDSLFGGSGDDTYIYKVGDGNDQISDSAGIDSLVFGPGVSRSAVSWDRSGDKLLISVGSDLLTISGWFSERDGAAQLEHLVFADGQIVMADEINQPWATLIGTTAGEELRGTDALGETIHGLGGDDRLQGFAGSDVLLGGDGNDLLEGGDDADVLRGDAGNDSLLGGEGDDVLQGGAGSDTQYGGRGSDTYIYHLGDGNDFLYDSEGVNEKLRFENIDRSAVSVSRSLADLAITINGTSETVTLSNWFVGGEDRIEILEFADSSSLSAAEIDAMFPITLGSEASETLTGDDGVNMLYGLGGDDVLLGMGGNDFLDGGSGANSLYGGLGDDTYVAGAGVIHEAQGEGTDTLLVTAGYRNDTLADNVENAQLVEGISDNTLIGNSLNNLLVGNSLSQTLDGGLGADILVGGHGDDSYVIDDLGDSVVEGLGGGYDTAYVSIDYTLANYLEAAVLSGNATSLYGNASDNVLVGNNLDNTLYGAEGNDTLLGGLGANVLGGGAGDDWYRLESYNLNQITELANEGVDTVALYVTENNASTGTFYTPDNVENVDVRFMPYGQLDVHGNSENNIIDARYAIDPSGRFSLLRVSLFGGDGNDSLYGNNDWDQIDGGLGDDFMAGGDEGDWYYVDSTNDQILELGWHRGNDRVYSTVNYALSDFIEELWLQGNSLTGIGNAQDNYILGTGGDDTLVGGAGSDRLRGLDGDDTYIFEIDIDTIIEDASRKGGTDTVLSAVSYTLAANVENLSLTGTAAINATGNELDNVLIGNAADNILDGRVGKDSMIGGAGDDTYFVDESRESITELAGEGNDTIITSVSHKLEDNVENLELIGSGAIDGTGNELDNWLTGNAGNNTLIGDSGNDHLIGGRGADILRGGKGSDTYYFGRGDSLDEITDQHSAKGKGPVPDNYDVLVFGDEISIDQLWFSQERSDLVVSVIGSGDQVTINNWYRKDDFHIEEFRTADGYHLLNSQVDNLVSAMSGFAPPPPGQTTLSDDYRAQLESVITSNWQA